MIQHETFLHFLRKTENEKDNEHEKEKERENESIRESGLASTCCTPLSVSNPLVRRFQSLSMSMVPECWHGDECPWHKRGRCLFKRAHRRGRACRAAVAGPPPCSPETGRSGHVERRRTHTASRERHSRDDDSAHPGHRCDSATEYGRAPGAHLGARARTDRRYSSAHRSTWRPSMSRFRRRRTSTRLPLCLS